MGENSGITFLKTGCLAICHTQVFVLKLRSGLQKSVITNLSTINSINLHLFSVSYIYPTIPLLKNSVIHADD
jgi:hypothetical protein